MSNNPFIMFHVVESSSLKAIFLIELIIQKQEKGKNKKGKKYKFMFMRNVIKSKTTFFGFLEEKI